MKLTLGFFHAYLITVPGLIRSGIVFLGVLCFIYESIGYENDFSEYRDLKYNVTYKGHGLGYKEEIMNEFFMAALLISWFISLIVLVALIAIKQAAQWKNLNRFLHLGVGLFLMTAWICGIIGIFTFRSNCCHVSNDLEYNKSPKDGYSLRCRCLLVIKRKPKYIRGIDFPEIYANKTEVWEKVIYRQAAQILSAYPHDFEAHCLAHGSIFVMVSMYLASSILV